MGISLLTILSFCAGTLFANYYQQSSTTLQLSQSKSTLQAIDYQQIPHYQLQNNYIISQNIYTVNNLISIAQNRDIRNYVKKMAIFGYNDYWGERLNMLMTGNSQKNTALSHLNSYYTYEKNKYDNYTYYYNSLNSTTHWYNYIFNRPISVVYRFLAENSYDNIKNMNKIYSVILY